MIEVRENYDEIKDLSLFYQPTLLRNILGIISVSLIMTWVEIAILRVLLLPQINASIVNKARAEGARANNENNQNIIQFSEVSPFFQPFQIQDASNQSRQKFRAGVTALEKDEARRNKTYNNFVSFITFVPWLVISFAAYLIFLRLKKDQTTLSRLVKQGKVEIFGFQMRATILSTVAGVLLFGFLQYSFYQMSLRWTVPEIDDLLYLSNMNVEQKVCADTTQ